MDRNSDLDNAIARVRVRNLLHLRSEIPDWDNKRIIAQLFVDDWNWFKYPQKDTDDSKAYHAYLKERCLILREELARRGIHNPESADHF